MRGAAISPKAAKRVRRRFQRLGARLTRDEGNSQGEIPVGEELDHPTNQSKRGAIGRVSRGGAAGREGTGAGGNIDRSRNRRTWPGGGGVSARNPHTGNTRMVGPIPKRGGLYGGGGRDTQ